MHHKCSRGAQYVDEPKEDSIAHPRQLHENTTLVIQDCQHNLWDFQMIFAIIIAVELELTLILLQLSKQKRTKIEFMS